MQHDNEINIKDTEKSFLTVFMGTIAKKNGFPDFWYNNSYIFSSVYGITKLEVENSFINYFDKETEIYKGMKKIDDDLGGTTPLNIILKFHKDNQLKIQMMNFLNGTRILIKMSKNQNIGSQEIKWIKF